MDIGSVLAKIGFDMPVFVYNLINFSILAFLLQKFFFKKTIATMEERQALIASGLEQAEVAVHTIEEAEQRKLRILQNAKGEADIIVEDAAKKANETTKKLSDSAKEEILAMKANAKEKIKKEKTQMVKNFKTEAVGIVLETASKVAKNGDFSEANVKTALVG